MWFICGNEIAMVVGLSLLWRSSGLFRAAKSRFAVKRSYQNTTVYEHAWETEIMHNYKKAYHKRVIYLIRHRMDLQFSPLCYWMPFDISAP